MIAGKIATLRDGQRPSPIGEVTTQKQAAQMLNVGKRTVERARTVLDHGIPQIQSAMEKDRIAVSEASQIAKLDSKVPQAA
jgi:hypothetical protein